MSQTYSPTSAQRETLFFMAMTLEMSGNWVDWTTKTNRRGTIKVTFEYGAQRFVFPHHHSTAEITLSGSIRKQTQVD